MSNTEKLKSHITNTYRSVREFTILSGIPYTTLDSIFRRGIANSSVRNVSKICSSLNISIESLVNNNEISSAKTTSLPNLENALKITETLLKCSYTLSNGDKLCDKDVKTILNIVREGLTRAK